MKYTKEADFGFVSLLTYANSTITMTKFMVAYLVRILDKYTKSASGLFRRPQLPRCFPRSDLMVRMTKVYVADQFGLIHIITGIF